MSEEQLKGFWEAIQADPSLQEKLKDIKDIATIESIAKEAGFEISAEDLANAKQELSDEDLEQASGGTVNLCLCYCFCS
jgi:predicted ribosomally synthesized peptide with nif11-like leader